MLEGSQFEEAVRAVRTACPGTAVGVSTGLWIAGGDPDRRREAVLTWRELPDFASVNLGEPGFAELVETLLDRGVAVEAGVWTLGDAESLLASGLADRCVRILVEAQETDAEAACASAEAMGARLEGVRAPQLHHGEGRAAWPVLDQAVETGRDIRIGLEDALEMPDGTPAPDNAGMVAEAVRRVRVAA